MILVTGATGLNGMELLRRLSARGVAVRALVRNPAKAEAIAAATINGAWALRLAHRKGSIESGKDADLAVFDVDDYREIPYWTASERCRMTVLNGVVADSRPVH